MKDHENQSAAVSIDALDRLLPLHFQAQLDGTITHFGPTIAKILGVDQTDPVSFCSLFTVRRPRNISQFSDFENLIGEKLVLLNNKVSGMRLPGLVEHLSNRRGYLFNLSLGAGVLRAVQDEALFAKDFAPTDTTVDLMYMLEVQSAVLSASRSLNNRLHGAKLLAEEQAYTDSLTGLNNRRALRRFIRLQLENNITRAFAVVLIDLDRFKAVNDTLGHAAGDYVLKSVAQKLLASTRPSDMVARVGGDEFVLVLPDFIDKDALKSFTERLVKQLAEPIKYGNETCQVGASMGATIAQYEDKADVDVLLNKSDEALYLSKQGGRGRVTLAEHS